MRFKYPGVILALAFSSLAHSQALYTEGVEYLRLQQPQPTDSGARVEVIEFFSYACPHCNEFEPFMVAWRKELPPGVRLKLVPVAFNPSWKALAQGYYAAEQLGVVDKLHEEMFAAIHKRREAYGMPEQVANIAAAAAKIDMNTFLEAMNSPDISRKIDESMQLLRAYGIQGVPTLAINGKFVTGGSTAGSHEQIIAVANYLIGLELATVDSDKPANPETAEKPNDAEAGDAEINAPESAQTTNDAKDSNVEIDTPNRAQEATDAEIDNAKTDTPKPAQKANDAESSNGGTLLALIAALLVIAIAYWFWRAKKRAR